MRILHLSTFDIDGGAARASHRLHTGLRRLGHDSVMMSLKRRSDDPSVVQFQYDRSVPSKFRRAYRRWKIKHDFAKYLPTRPKGHEPFSDDRSEFGAEIAERLPPADVISLHLIAGYVDQGSFFPNLPKDVPVVWRLADMNPLTGGCHYDERCGKFEAKCGACPQLGSTDENDLSRQVWERRHAALAHMTPDRLHLAATSTDVANDSRRSSLLKRFPVTVIANGLDSDDFAPRDRMFARDVLGVPRDARVVLYVAQSLTNKRKGFAPLLEALTGIEKDVPNTWLVTVGRAKGPPPGGLPGVHLGEVGSDRYLSLIYSAADVFVCPSLQETFGQTVIESQACGTPVVGFNTGGMLDTIVPGKTGYRGPVGDPVALRDGIVKIIGNPEHRAEMSAECRRIVMEKYTVEKQAEGYARLYESLLAKRSGAASTSAPHAIGAAPVPQTANA